MAAGIKTPVSETTDLDRGFGMSTPKRTSKWTSDPAARTASTVAVHLAKTAAAKLVVEPPTLGPFAYDLYSLPKVVRRIAQMMLIDLAGTLTTMDAVDVAPGLPGGGDMVTTDIIPGSVNRKTTFLDFCARNRDRLMQLLVLYSWTRAHGRPSKKLIDLVISQRENLHAITEGTRQVGVLKVDLDPFKLPPPDLMTALTVLGMAEPQRLRWSDFGFIKRKPASARLALSLLADLNIVLSVRMAAHIGRGRAGLPLPMTKWRVGNGRVTFIVPGEFEVDLSVADDEADPAKAQWWFVDFRWAFGPIAQLPDLSRHRAVMETMVNDRLAGAHAQLVGRVAEEDDDDDEPDPTSVVADIRTAVAEVPAIPTCTDTDAIVDRLAEYAVATIDRPDSIADRSGLSSTYDLLHNVTLTHKITILRHQAVSLARTSGRWVGSLFVEPSHRVLIVQYWSAMPGPKSWIEVGVKSGQVPVRTRDPRTGKLGRAPVLGRDWRGTLPSRPGVRWIQCGDVTDLATIPGVAELRRRAIDQAARGNGHDWAWETSAVGLGDLSRLDIEAGLVRVVSVAAIRLMERIAHRLVVPAPQRGVLLGPAVVTTPDRTSLIVGMEVRAEAETNRAAQIGRKDESDGLWYPNLTVRLGGSGACPNTIIHLEPVGGAFGVLPMSDQATRLASQLNRIDSRERMAGTAVATAVKRHVAAVLTDSIASRAEQAGGWKVSRGWRVHTDRFGRLAAEFRPAKLARPPEIVGCVVLRPLSWSSPSWIVVCTVTFEEAERWWLVDVDRLYGTTMADTPAVIPEFLVRPPDRVKNGPVFGRSTPAPISMATTILPRSVIEVCPPPPADTLSPRWFNELEAQATAVLGGRAAMTQLVADAVNFTTLKPTMGVGSAVPIVALRLRDLLQVRDRKRRMEVRTDRRIRPRLGLGGSTVFPPSRAGPSLLPGASPRVASVVPSRTTTPIPHSSPNIARRVPVMDGRPQSGHGPAPPLPSSQHSSRLPDGPDPDDPLAGVFAADVVRVSLGKIVRADNQTSNGHTQVVYLVHGVLQPRVAKVLAARPMGRSRSPKQAPTVPPDPSPAGSGTDDTSVSDKPPAPQSASLLTDDDIKVAVSGAFIVPVSLPLGASFVLPVADAVRRMCRLAVVMSELAAAGLSSRISSWSTSSVAFSYDDPAWRRPLAGPPIPAAFSLSLSLSDPTAPIDLVIPSENPHAHWRGVLQPLLAMSGPSSSGGPLPTGTRIAIRNLLFSLAHTAALARSLTGLTDLDAVLTSVLPPRARPRSAEQTIQQLDGLIAANRFSASVIRELGRCRKRVMMQHQSAVLSARTSAQTNPVQAAVLLATSVLTLQPTGVAVVPKSARAVRIVYSRPRLVIDAKMMEAGPAATARQKLGPTGHDECGGMGGVTWLFEVVYPPARTAGHAAGQSTGLGSSQTIGAGASSLFSSLSGRESDVDESALATSLRSIFSAHSRTWTGYGAGAVSRPEGVDELVWRIDQVVRALRAAAVSKTVRASLAPTTQPASAATNPAAGVNGAGGGDYKVPSSAAIAADPPASVGSSETGLVNGVSTNSG